MWTRKEIKAKGKAAFKGNYWRCVLVAIVISLIGSIGGGSASYTAQQSVNDALPEEITINGGVSSQDFSALGGAITGELTTSPNSSIVIPEDFELTPELIAAILGVVLIVCVIAFIFQILLVNPLKVGCTRFFAENSKEPAKVGEVGYGFDGGYKRIAGGMLRKDIYQILWLLLFIIPGIVKSYSYCMVPYILAEEPELSGKEAITRSRQMMNGNKWKAFVLDLSWILWDLFGAVTLGIGYVFYVNPYVRATEAELYYALKGEDPSALRAEPAEPVLQ